MNERIRWPAVLQVHSGRIVTGFRHRDIHRQIFESNGYVRLRTVDGFVTEVGRFVDRQEGARIALAAGQVPGGKLSNPKLGLTSDELEITV
jgi:hypothetical protein